MQDRSKPWFSSDFDRFDPRVRPALMIVFAALPQLETRRIKGELSETDHYAAEPTGVRFHILTSTTATSFPDLPLLAVGQLDRVPGRRWADVSGLNYISKTGRRRTILGAWDRRSPTRAEMISWPFQTEGRMRCRLTRRGRHRRVCQPFPHCASEPDPEPTGSGFPFELKPLLQQTTLLWSTTPLVYGRVNGSGVPPINGVMRYYFTGVPMVLTQTQNSGDPNDARFDTEGIRVSNDGKSVFISDEYGPYIYQFDRNTGVRLRTFALPSSFYVTNLSPMGATEISGNTVGRTANKGMEGLQAITPDGKTLVGTCRPRSSRMLSKRALQPTCLSCDD